MDCDNSINNLCWEYVLCVYIIMLLKITKLDDFCSNFHFSLFFPVYLSLTINFPLIIFLPIWTMSSFKAGPSVIQL